MPALYCLKYDFSISGVFSFTILTAYQQITHCIPVTNLTDRRIKGVSELPLESSVEVGLNATSGTGGPQPPGIMG